MFQTRYWREGLKCWRQFGAAAPGLGELRRWRTEWSASRTAGRNSLDDESPWITYGAREFLDGFLQPRFRVFEWGSGGSSLFFARRVAQVISVEHDANWFELVQAEARHRGLKNWQGWLELPEQAERGASTDPASCDSYCSDGEEYRGRQFGSYARRIDSYIDGVFDVVMIDGRARPSCLKHALSKVRPGGCLVWDNSERGYYEPAMRRVPPEFVRQDFAGPGPYIVGFWRTTVWVRRSSAPARLLAA